MAERRMFAKTIIDSDAFIDMPLSTQALYFHLSMRADDEGFINNPRKIQRMIGASDDDLKVLAAKRFIIPFDSGIVVIKHWKIHNYIRGDRKKETVYTDEMELLTEKDNGAYTLKSEEPLLLEEPSTETPRQKAYRESTLPYSFEYKIRQAFYGEPCPVCGAAMRGHVDEAGIGTNSCRPSIQHNIPISKGGKHELGNISVICHHCNITLQDTETGSLNADEVIRKWDEICMTGKCQSNVSQVTDKCHTQVRLGKDRDRIEVGEGSKGKKETPIDLLHRLMPDYIIPNDLKDKLDEWIIYKTERKETYKEVGMKSLLRQIENNQLMYGEKAVCDLIDDSMANGWKGIIFDRLKKMPVRSYAQRTSTNPFLDMAGDGYE